MKILVTGANGLLGQHLIDLLLKTSNYIIVATGKGVQRTAFKNDRLIYLPLDICDGVAVHSLMEQVKPDCIIHCAALTQADECELNEVKCWDVNVTATRFLVDAAKKCNAFFISLSTDFVFDGLQGPYKEEDATNPLSYYGSSKLAAEKAVLESGLSNAVVRTCLVYGDTVSGTRSNIITWVKTNLEQGKPIKVVSDQWRTPTYIEDLARGILLIAEKKATGIFHISGEEMLTPYDMAMATADYMHFDKSLIEKVDASVFTQPANRPAKTGFIIDKAKTVLGFTPVSFAEGLKLVLDK
ncbi:MAG: SDR family oxidoreductase [Ferruginibacter sp.]